MQNPVSAHDYSQLSTQLASTLSSLDAQRLTYVKKSHTGLIIGAAVAVVLAGIALAFNLGWLGAIVPFIIGIVIAVWTYSSARGAYSNEFKALVMPSLVSQFGNLTYQAKPGLGEGEFVAANLFTRPDRYNSEDLVSGTVGATNLRFSEVHAEERYQTRDSKGNTRTEYRDIFKGLFFIFDFNKNFHGQTYVLPEDVTGSLGNFGKMFQRWGAQLNGRGELIQLEDPEFEGLFKVNASDQTEARYILSSALMRRLVDLRQRQNNVVAAAFIGGQMYLMLAKTEDWFEAPPLNTPLDFNALGGILQQLTLATRIVEDLDLNTRIWSKQ